MILILNKNQLNPKIERKKKQFPDCKKEFKSSVDS